LESSSLILTPCTIIRDEPRFSLIYTEYSGARRRFSYFKRFTYFVSPRLTNKTFLKQIGEGDFSSLEKIKEAFSVEPVTKQFYEEIQNWYFWAMDKVKFPEDYKYSNDNDRDKEIRIATNLIRLITRIIFIWFIKEKGLIPEVLFDREKLKGIIRDFGNPQASNYYNAILQNLFFATLNQKMNERRFASEKGYPLNKSEYGVKTLYRYKDKFLVSEKEVLGLFKEIPFLNGGLFDCLDKEDEAGKVIYIDGFSRNPKKQALIPDYLFFQQDETRVDLSTYGLGSNKQVRGLIEILKSYNFTIDESTPVDQEVALDPELLGKVFENLLASYNPETATTARKATGSYYTPREIVDYMVDESLKEYFKIQLPGIDEEKIEQLVSYAEESPEFSQEEKQRIISAIDRAKILDPACGSGAFPMGILHKLVYILQKIDPNNDLWYELQYQKALRASEEVFKEKDKSEREAMLKEINEAFDESINYPDYARKLYLIENCIYGIDIQPIAIQISKLRFFISLVLDQKIDRTKENFGIRALPNLETKFVAANTLIGLERPKQLQLRNPEIEREEKELKDIRHRYFTAKTRAEKLKLQERDREIRKKIAQLLINDGWGERTAHKIASFDLFDQNASADWFDPEWMFGVVDGFDIVIGNPPHGADISKYKDYVESNFKFFETRKNSASLFIEKSFEPLKQEGVLAYVIPKSITFVESWKKTRDLIYKKNRLLVLIDITKAFENVKLEQIILICQNTQNDSYLYNTGDFWDGYIRINTKIKTEIADKLEILPLYTNEIKMGILNKLLENSVKLYSISKTFRGLPYQISGSSRIMVQGVRIRLEDSNRGTTLYYF
jgi:adenine-specific DNA-methyltransferase